MAPRPPQGLPLPSANRILGANELRALAKKHPDMALDLTTSYLKCMQQAGTSQAMSGGLQTASGQAALINSASAGEPSRTRKEPSAAKPSKRQRVGPSPGKAAGGQADVQGSLAAPLAAAGPGGSAPPEPDQERSRNALPGGAVESGTREASADPIFARLLAQLEKPETGAGRQDKNQGGAVQEAGPGVQDAASPLLPQKLSGKSSLEGQAQAAARVPDGSLGLEQPRRVSSSPSSLSVPRASPPVQGRGLSEDHGLGDALAAAGAFRRALSPGGHEPLGEVLDPNPTAARMLTRLHTMSLSPGPAGSSPQAPAPTLTPSPGAEARLAAIINSLTPASEDAPLEPARGGSLGSLANLPSKAASARASASGSPPLSSAKGGPPVRPPAGLAGPGGSIRPSPGDGQEPGPGSPPSVVLTVALDQSERVCVRLGGLVGSVNGAGGSGDAAPEVLGHGADGIVAGGPSSGAVRARGGSGLDSDGSHASQAPSGQELQVQTGTEAALGAIGQSPDQAEVTGQLSGDEGSHVQPQTATEAGPVVPPVGRNHGGTPVAGDEEVPPALQSHGVPASEGPLTGDVSARLLGLGSGGLLVAPMLHSVGAHASEDGAATGAAGLLGSDTRGNDTNRPESAALTLAERVQDVPVPPGAVTDCSLKEESGLVATNKHDEAGRHPGPPRHEGPAHSESTEGAGLVVIQRAAQSPQPGAASGDDVAGEAGAVKGPGPWQAAAGLPLPPEVRGAQGEGLGAVAQAVGEGLHPAVEESGGGNQMAEPEQPVHGEEAPSVEQEGAVTEEGMQNVLDSESEGKRSDQICRVRRFAELSGSFQFEGYCAFPLAKRMC